MFNHKQLHFNSDNNQFYVSLQVKRLKADKIFVIKSVSKPVVW